MQNSGTPEDGQLGVYYTNYHELIVTTVGNVCVILRVSNLLVCGVANYFGQFHTHRIILPGIFPGSSQSSHLVGHFCMANRQVNVPVPWYGM